MQREDDKAETVAKRLDVFDSETKPLIEYYHRTGALVKVDGLLEVEAVASALLQAIKLENAR